MAIEGVFELEPERGCKVEVWEKDSLDEIDLIFGAPGEDSSGAYLTSDEADSVAVALIQATPMSGANDADIDATNLHFLLDEPWEYRLALGIALIRSARKS